MSASHLVVPAYAFESFDLNIGIKAQSVNYKVSNDVPIEGQDQPSLQSYQEGSSQYGFDVKYSKSISSCNN